MAVAGEEPESRACQGKAGLKDVQPPTHSPLHACGQHTVHS